MPTAEWALLDFGPVIGLDIVKTNGLDEPDDRLETMTNNLFDFESTVIFTESSKSKINSNTNNSKKLFKKKATQRRCCGLGVRIFFNLTVIFRSSQNVEFWLKLIKVQFN